jgi:hypothetical protein
LAPSRDVADNLVLAVDEALLVPGEIVRTAIYDRIERSYQIRYEEIPEKLETFDKVIRAFLGTSAKNLHNDLGLAINEDGNWKLVDYVNHARKAQTSA